MRWKAAVFVLGMAAAVFLGVALRLHTRAQTTAGDRVHPLDSDSAYHMRRARFAVERFPRTILFDPLMNFPSGGVAIWPPLFDLALAAPARLAHGAEAPAGAVERGAAWVPVALAAGAIALAGLLARRLYGALAGATAALFLAACPGHILWTQYAHTDQHAAEFADLGIAGPRLGQSAERDLAIAPGDGILKESAVRRGASDNGRSRSEGKANGQAGNQGEAHVAFLSGAARAAGPD